MGLGTQVVDFVGFNLLDDANQAHRVGEVSVVKNKLSIGFVWVLVEVVNAIGIEG